MERTNANRLPVLISIGTLVAGLGGCSYTDKAGGHGGVGSIEIQSFEDIEWSALNPARGDASPRAATLWGDRGAGVPTGFLVRFEDGFSSPPHIHNVTYRGVVIDGTVHNDDPSAEKMWMPAGSFWTQPAGQVHITAAKGDRNLAYIEIDDGPYLVLPEDEALLGDERPINVDRSNLVWLDAAPVDPSSSKAGPEIAYLWGEPGADGWRGVMFRLPAGYRGVLHSRGGETRCVVIGGEVAIGSTAETLTPGGWFGSEQGGFSAGVSCETAAMIYVRSNGAVGVE